MSTPLTPTSHSPFSPSPTKSLYTSSIPVSPMSLAPLTSPPFNTKPLQEALPPNPHSQAGGGPFNGSIQSRNITRTTFLPLASLMRPIPPVLDEEKILRMVETLKRSQDSDSPPSPGAPTKLPPVDVLLYIQKKAREDGNGVDKRELYFAFGACHRLQAYERMKVDKVECKVLKVTRGMLGGYLGGSLGTVLGEE